MKINCRLRHVYQDCDERLDTLDIYLEEGERIAVGDVLDIPMMDGSTIQREVKALNPHAAGDFAPISDAIARGVAEGRYRTSKSPVTSIEGPAALCQPILEDVPFNEVLSTENMDRKEFYERRAKMFCLTPFKELHLGRESIYDWVEEGYSVPVKVIAYLKTTEPDMMSPGVYEHPFIPGKRLLGPYCYTDGHYWWDRDTWKYVTKYHVRLPQEFVDFVMSGAGDEFARTHIPYARSWFETIESNYGDEPHANFLPQDAGDINIDQF